MHRWGRGQIAEDQPQWVIGPDLVVTVGDDDEDVKLPDPAAEEAQELDRSAISPMGVFGDDDHRLLPRGEGREDLAKEPIPRVTVKSILVNAQAKGGGQVAEGTERGRRGESIAGSTQHRRGLGDLTTERRDQTSLANSGFTTHEHQSPLPCGCMTQMFAQVIEGLLALE